MSEQYIISKTSKAITQKDLVTSFHEIGVNKDDTLLVHTSLSALGWVCGGPVTVIEALLESVGSMGTIVMPTHTAGNTDPRNWQNPPVPNSWWESIRESMPAFDPDKTPTLAMGVVAEAFRKWPEVKRSSHPIGSFAALGPKSDDILYDHDLKQMFGEGSPIAKLYDLNAKVLLLGVGHESNTSLHLAEYRADFKKTYIQEGCAMFV